jgi:hypothetical protein
MDGGGGGQTAVCWGENTNNKYIITNKGEFKLIIDQLIS